jgi:HlyD family secretion protein
MSANVDIMTRTEVNVLSVPIQSVTVRDTTKKEKEQMGKGGEKDVDNDGIRVVDEKAKDKEKEEKKTECVFIVDSGKVKMQWVKVGIQDNNYIEIKEGLKEGQSVVAHLTVSFQKY